MILPVFIFLAIIALLFIYFAVVAPLSASQQQLVAERDHAIKRLDEKEKQIKDMTAETPKCKENNDKAFWAVIFKNKPSELGEKVATIRVGDRLFKKLSADPEFLSNTSGSYNNILGLYRGQKVMYKLPTGKARKHVDSNTKAK